MLQQLSAGAAINCDGRMILEENPNTQFVYVKSEMSTKFPSGNINQALWAGNMKS